jgi:hypothetical protein
VNPLRRIHWGNLICILLIGVNIGCISLLAIVPPVSRDALTHHLYIPKLYLQHGGIYEIPHLVFSYYPMNLDLLYLIALYFNNDIAPKFIHFSFAVITAALIYRYLARRINTTYALLGALFFLTIPVIIRLSSTVYVDLGLICFLFFSLIFLFDWIESGFKFKFLFFSAVCCGLALGTKYNGLVGLFLLGLFVPFVYARYHINSKKRAVKAIGWSAVFVFTAMLVFSPWMIRNIAWKGNPVYPLYENVFNHQNSSIEEKVDAIPEAQSRMSHIQVRREIYGESWVQIALIPLRVFLQGQDDNPQYFDGKTNVFLLVLPFLAFLGFRSRPDLVRTELAIMVWFSVLFFLFACAQASIRIRYFAPILPPLVIVSMFGLYNLKKHLLKSSAISEAVKKLIFFAIIFVMLGLNVIYMMNLFKKDQVFAYRSGKISRDEYIQLYRPEYAALQYANTHLNANSKIFGLYIGNRGYYSDHPIEFPIEMLQRTADLSLSGQDIAKNLHKKGFTHIVANFSLFNFWVQKYTPHQRQMLKQFFEFHTISEFSKDGHGVLRLIVTEESAPL